MGIVPVIPVLKARKLLRSSLPRNVNASRWGTFGGPLSDTPRTFDPRLYLPPLRPAAQRAPDSRVTSLYAGSAGGHP